jgi:putative transposase
MPRNSKTAAASGTAALPQLTKQMLEELIPGPVTKEQFTDIFENFKKAFIEPRKIALRVLRTDKEKPREA